MGVRNLHWHSLNAGRCYPLDESATLLSDAGRLLPNDVLVDCRLSFPQSLARYAFLGAMSVTEHAVTVTFLGSQIPARQSGCDDAETQGQFTPLAAVALSKAGLVVGRNYAVTPLGDGVGGWVTFGDGVFNSRNGDPYYYGGRFSTVAQSLLAPRAARSYRDPPVTSVGRLGEATSLKNLVRLKAGVDMAIEVEELTIQGRTRQAIVFKLQSTTPVGEGRNVFELYRGPCADRPESGNCEGDPIERINAVQPDCCGRISLNFVGCASLTPTADGHGVVIDCGIGLTDVCAGPDKLPDLDGKLPNERDGECPDA